MPILDIKVFLCILPSARATLKSWVYNTRVSRDVLITPMVFTHFAGPSPMTSHMNLQTQWCCRQQLTPSPLLVQQCDNEQWLGVKQASGCNYFLSLNYCKLESKGYNWTVGIFYENIYDKLPCLFLVVLNAIVYQNSPSVLPSPNDTLAMGTCLKSSFNKMCQRIFFVVLYFPFQNSWDVLPHFLHGGFADTWTKALFFK